MFSNILCFEEVEQVCEEVTSCHILIKFHAKEFNSIIFVFFALIFTLNSLWTGDNCGCASTNHNKYNRFLIVSIVVHLSRKRNNNRHSTVFHYSLHCNVIKKLERKIIFIQTYFSYLFVCCCFFFLLEIGMRCYWSQLYVRSITRSECSISNSSSTKIQTKFRWCCCSMFTKYTWISDSSIWFNWSWPGGYND